MTAPPVRPDRYWDHREARWVRVEPKAAEPRTRASASIPVQHDGADEPTPVAAAGEADVRSG